MSLLFNELEIAWSKRAQDFKESTAVRVFHGPGEGRGTSARLAIEVFGSSQGTYAWVYEWEGEGERLSDGTKQEIARFLESKKVLGAVFLSRPEKDTPANASLHFGELPASLKVKEFKLQYEIRFENVKHPGLFLDHAPLRSWLISSGAMRGKTVLNTFSYTGSLSVAARAGGAAHVTTLDLSRPTIEWAKINWSLNRLPEESADFIFGDVFEWLPKFKKRDRIFDVVILDPPSFSRGVKGNFSTSRDLVRLHSLAQDLISPDGLLITSINSKNISKDKYLFEIEKAAKESGRKIRVVRELGAPESSFPKWDSLKGWVFQVN